MTTFSLLIALAGCNDNGVTAFNASPEAAITSHVDGAEVFEGMTVTFRGSASDPDDATATLTTTWYLGTAEACPATLADATGVTSCDIAIGLDDTEVTLEVTDPGAASGSASITLTVVPTDSPDAEVVTPEASGVYYSDQKITFEGVVSDGEDAAEDLTAYWESDIDGLLKDVEAVPNAEGAVDDADYLSEGEHYLTLTAEDTTGKTGSDSVTITVGPPNSGPTCSITAPDDNSAGPEGELVIFEGLVDDVDVPADWLAVAWSSDKDGDLGASTPNSDGTVSFPFSDLSVETHVVTLTATDEIGATCTNSIIYTVGEPPEVEITLPTDGSVLQQGDAVTFTATVSDNEDLPNEVALVWSSDVDGVLSKAGSDSSGSAIHVTSGLSAGPHLITLLGTDTDGLFSTDTVYITINEPPVIDSIDITPATGVTTTTTLTCTATSTDPEDGALTPDYTWDNLSTAAPLGSGSGLTLTAADVSPGDEVACTATITDTDGATASVSTSVFVENSAPSISSVTINPNPATATDTLTCSWSGFSDADGDSDASTINWTINGVDSGTSTVLMSGFVGGDTVTCTVTAFDGTDDGTVLSDTIVIDNTAPVLDDVLLEPTPAYEDTTLTCTPGSATDSDGAAITFNYAWTVNSVGIAATSTTLTGADFDKNDDVFCTVTPTDGSDSGAAIDSDTVTIQNTAPEAPFISIIPAAPIAGADDLVCSVDVDSYDLDGDSVSYDYEWAVDGAYHSTGSTVPGTDTNAGETWTCTVTPNDGDEDGASSSASVVIEAPAVEECWSLEFDGVDDYIYAASSASFDIDAVNGGTIEAWLFIHNIENAQIIGRRDDPSLQDQWSLRTSATGSLNFEYGNSSDSYYGSISSDPPYGVWFHYAVVLSQSGSKAYINGEESYYYADWHEELTSDLVAADINVGRHSLSPSPDYYFSGKISNIAIYDFEVYSTTFVPSVLISEGSNFIWRLDSGSGTIAYDSSGNGNDGTIDGATWVEDCPEAPEGGLGSTEDNPGIDCLDILESGYSTGDGIYWIDPDGTSAFEVYCDMTTDGGGWTRLFVTETTNNAFDVAPETSTFPGLDYTIDNQTLRDDAVTALVTYVDSSDDIVGSYATFDFPTNWKSQSPLMYSNESESVDVSVNGIYIGSEILVYGKDNWTTYTCDDEWGNSFTSGQFCITNTTAPYYTRWASEIVDRCTDSNSNEQPGLGGAECTTDTRFSILVRRSTEEPALSCLDILESGDSTGDGTYWIDPDGTGAFEVYCDMTTYDGGWMLCGSSGPSDDHINYGFDDYGSPDPLSMFSMDCEIYLREIGTQVLGMNVNLIELQVWEVQSDYICGIDPFNGLMTTDSGPTLEYVYDSRAQYSGQAVHGFCSVNNCTGYTNGYSLGSSIGNLNGQYFSLNGHCDYSCNQEAIWYESITSDRINFYVR
jgi:hypothetical protein